MYEVAHPVAITIPAKEKPEVLSKATSYCKTSVSPKHSGTSPIILRTRNASHLHKNSAIMEYKGSNDEILQQIMEVKSKSILNQSSQGPYQLRSPVKQVIDDFSNNTYS